MAAATTVESLTSEERAIFAELMGGDGSLLLSGSKLSRALGFPTLTAMNRAVSRAVDRGMATIPVFRLPGRRGLFGWAPDIARLIARHRAIGPTNE